MGFKSKQKYEVIWLNSFKEELSHIYHYLVKELNQVLIAKKLHKKILKLLSYLYFYPELYQKINHNKDVRRIPIGKYVILYTIDNYKKQVFVLHIYHGNKNYLDRL